MYISPAGLVDGGTPVPLQKQNVCITFVQCWTNVEDVGPTLYKCYTNVLCLLGCGAVYCTAAESQSY